MTNYELILVLKKELNFKKRVDLIKEIIKFILKSGGIIVKLQYLGLQSVYYSKKAINKGEKGKYTLLRFSMDSSSLVELDTVIKQDTNIIRHLFVKSTNI